MCADCAREIDISWPEFFEQVSLPRRRFDINSRPASLVKIVRVGIFGWMKCADVHVEAGVMIKQKMGQDRVFASL